MSHAEAPAHRRTPRNLLVRRHAVHGIRIVSINRLCLVRLKFSFFGCRERVESVFTEAEEGRESSCSRERRKSKRG